MLDAGEYVKNILLRRTKRDTQKRVGASNISTACTRCLADDLLGIERPQSVYDMGAIVGTAIHDYLDKRNQDDTAYKERKVVLGSIEGYGEIKSTTDLFIESDHHVIDFKTTTRDKLKYYIRSEQQEPTEYEITTVTHARDTINQYFRQANLYALGLEREGFLPDYVSIVFVCRDGQIVDRDVYGITRVYDKTLALQTLARTEELWKWLHTDGNDINDLPSQEDCFFCENVRMSVPSHIVL